MRAVTIKEAKAHLNELIEAARNGEQVVLLRGSEHVAAIVPISAADLEIKPQLTDRQADSLWQLIAEERRAGKLATYETPEDLVLNLSDAVKTRRRKVPAGKRPPKTRRRK